MASVNLRRQIFFKISPSNASKRTPVLVLVMTINLHYCLSYDPTVMMPYKEIPSSELNITGNTIQCNETRFNIKTCAKECFEMENKKENCVGFLANENNCSLCKVLDRDGINNNLNTIISDSQVLYLLKVPEIDPNIYISMDDFNLSTGVVKGNRVKGGSTLISADDLISGKVGQAIHFHSGGRMYPAVDQPECFCSFYYCNGTMSLSLWARSYTAVFQHVITPRDDSGLVVAFNDGKIPAGWFRAKDIYIDGYRKQIFSS